MIKKILVCIVCFGALGQVSFAEENPVTNDKTFFSYFQEEEEVFNVVMKAIPSPVEISQLIKNINPDYNKSHLSSHKNHERFESTYKRALNLGVFSTDLGFAGLFNRRQDGMNYLNTVKSISEELNLGKFFNSASMKSAQDAMDKGTLAEYGTIQVDKINNYLVDQHREYVSVLMLTGGWVEAMHISLKVYNSLPESKSAHKSKLKEKIGDQKDALDQLLVVLELYKKPSYSGLISDLRKLQGIYDDIKVVVVQHPTITKIDSNGQPYVSGGDVKYVKVTDSDINKIENAIKSVRDSVVK
jgi:hypothetical protein